MYAPPVTSLQPQLAKFQREELERVGERTGTVAHAPPPHFRVLCLYRQYVFLFVPCEVFCRRAGETYVHAVVRYASGPINRLRNTNAEEAVAEEFTGNSCHC